MTSITSDSPFVITGPTSESVGSSQQIDVSLAPKITVSGDNTRLLAR